VSAQKTPSTIAHSTIDGSVSRSCNIRNRRKLRCDKKNTVFVMHALEQAVLHPSTVSSDTVDENDHHGGDGLPSLHPELIVVAFGGTW